VCSSDLNPIGAHSSGLIGEFPSGIPNNLMPYITQTAAGVREKLSVFGDDYHTKDGTAVRDYIHVVDLADAHVKAVCRLISGHSESNIETINLGTGIGYSVLEVIKAFEAVSGKPLNYEVTKRREGDVAELYASTTLAKKLLNWEAKFGLESMIQSSWDWEQNLRNE
jgi:UDP-glucose 4-epimerase